MRIGSLVLALLVACARPAPVLPTPALPHVGGPTLEEPCDISREPGGPRGRRAARNVDFDGDGFADLAVGGIDAQVVDYPDGSEAVVGDEIATVYIYRGGPAGLRGPVATITSPEPTRYDAHHDVIGGLMTFDDWMKPIGDVDGDGAWDLAIEARHPGGAAEWLIYTHVADHPRLFARGPRPPGGPVNTPDLVTWDARAATFIDAPEVDRAAAAHLRPLAIDDIDGDGARDVLAAEADSVMLARFTPYLARGERLVAGVPNRFLAACQAPARPRPDPTAGGFVPAPVPLLEPRALGLELADVTGDGRADLVIPVATRGVELPRASIGTYTQPTAYQLWVFRGTPRGLERDPTARIPLDDGAFAYQVTVRTSGDVDGDGFEDVVVSAPTAIRIYRGGPDGLRADRWTALPPPRGFQPAHDRLGPVARR